MSKKNDRNHIYCIIDERHLKNTKDHEINKNNYATKPGNFEETLRIK